jgi:hypothetical protein
MNRFVHGYLLVKWIRILNRAVFYTGGASCALVFNNISGAGFQSHLKITFLSFYGINFCKCKNLYVWMPADLDQFRRENSHRAVVGGKGLVKLGHMAANAWSFLYQVNLETGSGKIKRSLNTADPSSNNHYVSKFFASHIFRNRTFR